MMNEKQYFHLCSDGRESRNFITGEADFIAAINILAVCAANTNVTIVSFSFQDTHYHILIFGERAECVKCKTLFETIYRHYISSTRKEATDAVPDGDLYAIGNDLEYLRNVAAYTIIQPTKDGKRVMPFDYRWGSGSLYFRSECYTHRWSFDKSGTPLPEVPFGTLDSLRKREVLHSRKYTVPDYWTVCGDIILPQNYVDIERFESIYRTHNSYRVFLSNNRKKEDEITIRIAQERGILLEDGEARQKCTEECIRLFGIRNPRKLDPLSRIRLAQQLHRVHRISYRQLAAMLRIHEDEIRSYVP